MSRERRSFWFLSEVLRQHGSRATEFPQHLRGKETEQNLPMSPALEQEQDLHLAATPFGGIIFPQSWRGNLSFHCCLQRDDMFLSADTEFQSYCRTLFGSGNLAERGTCTLENMEICGII